MDISISYGKATFSSQSVKLANFVYPPGQAREVVSSQYKDKASVYVPVSAYADYDGSFNLSSYDVPEGAILCVQAIRTFNGTLAAEAAVFLRVRSQGPLLSIALKLPPHARSIVQGNIVSAFQGRADIVSAEEAVGYGAIIPDWYVRKYTNTEEIEECFDITEIDPEISASPQVVRVVESTDEGPAIMLTRRRRRVRIDRG